MNCKKRHNIITFALLLAIALSFQACQQEDFTKQTDIDRETLIAQGRYLTARSEDAMSISDNILEPKPFKIGTPFRLLAFTKAYKENDTEENRATNLRFNTVTWEEALSDEDMRFMNIKDTDPNHASKLTPDQLFGFSHLEGEDATGKDGLVALDFYGFTYGTPADASPEYIKLDEETSTTNASGTEGTARTDIPEIFKTKKRTEMLNSIQEETSENGVQTITGELNDLMRGELLNRNIENAGMSEINGTSIVNPYTQSIIPFRHCFSKLRFQISQQEIEKEETDADGNPVKVPVYDDLCLENIEVTNTYSKGSVYLYDGKVELIGDPINRPLKFSEKFDPNKPITTTNQEVGEMIVFPSDGSSLTNMPANQGDGYNVGLKITVRSKDQELIKRFLKNTNTPEEGNLGTKEITNKDGVKETWHTGTIVKDHIVDYYDHTKIETDNTGNVSSENSGNAVKFKQNNSYMLIITFQEDQVRIITVIPQVVEWIDGETSFKDENGNLWQEQEMGQPQMFDNIVWSDRNLGADAFDPKTDFEKTMGYFYQAGRNIPYYPFMYSEYSQENPPTPAGKNNQSFGKNNTAWKHSVYRFYPMVDSEIINMSGNNQWTIDYNSTPVMNIPETRPQGSYFDFMIHSKNKEASEGLAKYKDKEWDKDKGNQPISGSWTIPTSKDYMSIFPTTPFAGNITFRRGGNCTNVMDWGPSGELNEMNESQKVLRITVPYYEQGMTEPTTAADIIDRSSDKYKEAWNILTSHGDSGSTPNNNDLYREDEDPKTYAKYEPAGDPEDGYASVYVISRETDEEIKNIVSLPEKYYNNENNKNNFAIKSWGTIYAIKRVYTPQAYRMRWRALIGYEGSRNPGIYIEICRYRCKETDRMNETNYKDYDWDHPAARIYFPVCGLGDYTGEYLNFGTECQYATSDPIKNGKTSAVQIKITGDNTTNAYIAIVKGQINRHFGMQIRPIAKTSLK